jgi:hypothetical protein
MPGPLEKTADAALWRRWRSAEGADRTAGEPDPLLLAAYAEGRLSEQAAEAIEAWLALNPLAIQDIISARSAQDAPLPAAEAIVARATALVGEHGAEILPFRRPVLARRDWRTTAGWSAMAASILVACLLGAAMGQATYTTLASSSADALDPSTGFLSFDEDSGS